MAILDTMDVKARSAARRNAKETPPPYNGETSHGLERGVYSAKKSEWSKNAGRELSDREVQEMVDATSDYTRNYKDLVALLLGYSEY